MLSLIPGLLAAGLAICGMGFYVLCLRSASRFRREGRNPRPTATPPVTILKPLRGVDPQMYESFRSHCVQDYPEYEIIFGVSEADDPAVEDSPACLSRGAGQQSQDQQPGPDAGVCPLRPHPHQ